MFRRQVCVRVVAASVLVVGAVGVSAAPASAAPAASNALTVVYKVKGTTHVAKSDLDVTLGPTSITTVVQPSGSLTGDLPIPVSHVSFLAFGYLPVTADVVFTQVHPATGSLSAATGKVVVTATAQYVISLRKVTVGGAAANVGSFCQTVSPVTLHVQTPAGQSFSIDDGGPITGTYRIGRFQDCRTTTDLTNILVPGDGNTVTLNLSQAKFVGTS